MRDRLIKAFDEWGLNQYIPFHTEREMLADYLIENGVILPKCKPGDTVYVITAKRPCYACFFCTDFCHKDCRFDDKSKMVIKKAKVRSTEFGGIDKIHLEIEGTKTIHSYNYTYWFSDIGKTVHLTRKAAEESLKKKNHETET